MAPVFGSDGFSDCNKLCDPDDGYWSSCQRICKGFKINTSAIAEPNASILSSTDTTKSIVEIIITPTMSFDTTARNNKIYTPSTDTSVTEFVIPPWTIMLIIALGTVFVLANLFILRKRLRNVCDHVFRWARNIICRRLSQFEKESEDVKEMKLMGSTVTEETKNLLEKEEKTMINNCIKPQKDGKPYTETSEIYTNSSVQEGNSKNAVVEDLEDAARSVGHEKIESLTADDNTLTGREIAATAYYDEQFHAITYGSGYDGNGDIDRENSDICSTSTESSIFEEINDAQSQTVPRSQGFQVPKQNADKSGVIRVITEINLRSMQ